jgi:hypothetical protein
MNCVVLDVLKHFSLHGVKDGARRASLQVMEHNTEEVPII